MTEKHKTEHIGWLRAAVLGANDGIVSTSSLIIGVASSGATHSSIIVAGIAGLVSGAVSMAAGEYVSVSSQSDTEKADIEMERKELEITPESELIELTNIYIKRGLKAELAKQVAEELTKSDALSTHIRDELGISESVSAKPIQAAFSSAGAFAVGASLPLIATYISPLENLFIIISITSLLFLGLLGALSAYIGGAKIIISTLRVTFWGALAMALTYFIGKIFGTTVV